MLKAFFGFFEKWGIPVSWGLVPLGFFAVVGILWLFSVVPGAFLVGLSWAFFFAPLWLPIALFAVFWPLWLHYIREKFITSQNYTLLEIRIPRDIMKSPRAMELVFEGFGIGSGESTFINRNIEGKVRPWWSFEIVSIDGQIHFYIWTRTGMRDIVETQIYAQYPTVEIYEVEDYATRFHFDPNVYGAWGCDFKLSKKDVYPIKTYIDYELDKDPKEEFKVDPIAHVFETLSSVGPGEQMWLQIIIRTNKDKRPKILDKKTKKTALFATEDRWKMEAEEEIADIKKKATPMRKEKSEDGTEKEVPAGPPMLSKGQEMQISAIERSLGKTAYDVGIRGVYIAKLDAFKPIRITSLLTIFRQFSSASLNGFAPTGWNAGFKGYPWEDIGGRKAAAARAGVIEAYKRRAWFFLWPDTPQHFVLTSEELATIYHFPSRTVQAPGLARIPATKAEAPSNLPV